MKIEVVVSKFGDGETLKSLFQQKQAKVKLQFKQM